jgi:hypothetical protein
MHTHFAYLDPGTGSLFFQALFGSILGGMFLFRQFMSKLALNFRKYLSRVEAVFLTQHTDK